MDRQKVYINSYSSYSCAGTTEELMEAIYAKKTKISIDSSYVKEEAVAIGKMDRDDFFTLLEEEVQTVLENSSLEDFSDTLLLVGSSVGGMKKSEKQFFQDGDYKNIDYQEHYIAVIEDFLKKRFSFKKARSFSTACTSSANALLVAKRLIEIGAYENIVVVGADSLCYTTVCGFHALGVLSSNPCKPFDISREGMNVSEGIAVLLIQNKQTQQSVILAGVGASSDAYHITNPDPEAKGAIKAMQHALKDAKITSNEVSYINAHGTGTVANDQVEALAVQTLFGSGVPLSSTKAITGHTLGAAGALEAIISCEVIKRGLIPPQSALKEAQNKNITLLEEAQEKEICYVVSNSFAFGGNNTSLVFGAVL